MGRIFRRLGIGVALAAVGYASLAAQQTPPASSQGAVQAFIASRMRSGWIAPKTPWGHPDIQGIFTTKDEGKGTGIGLYLSKLIIENNMSGRLTARNTAEGAEFRIEL